MKEEKLEKLIRNLQLIFKVQKNTIDAFLSVIPSRSFVPNVIPTKKTALPEIGSKGAGKRFLVKVENKMLLLTIKIL